MVCPAEGGLITSSPACPRSWAEEDLATCVDVLRVRPFISGFSSCSKAERVSHGGCGTREGSRAFKATEESGRLRHLTFRVSSSITRADGVLTCQGRADRSGVTSWRITRRIMEWMMGSETCELQWQ